MLFLATKLVISGMVTGHSGFPEPFAMEAITIFNRVNQRKNGHFFNSKLLNFRRVEQYKFPVPLFFSDDPCGGRVSLDDDLGRHHLVAGHIILLVEAEVQEPL